MADSLVEHAESVTTGRPGSRWDFLKRFGRKSRGTGLEPDYKLSNKEIKQQGTDLIHEARDLLLKVPEFNEAKPTGTGTFHNFNSFGEQGVYRKRVEFDARGYKYYVNLAERITPFFLSMTVEDSSDKDRPFVPETFSIDLDRPMISHVSSKHGSEETPTQPNTRGAVEKIREGLSKLKTRLETPAESSSH